MMQNQIVSYVGYPERYVNGAYEDADCNHYIIYCNPTRQDGVDRQLYGLYIPYEIDETQLVAHSEKYINWYPDYTSGTNATLFTRPSSVWGSDATIAKRAKGCIELQTGFTYPGCPCPSLFGAGKLTTYNLLPAALGVFEWPTSLTEEQLAVYQRDVDSGQIIRGYEANEAQSLGMLAHMTGDGTHLTEYVERMTRRCLFQFPHPVGIYIAGGEGGFSGNIFGARGVTLKTRTRNLCGDSAGVQACFPALVYSLGEEGCSITYTSAATTDTWTYNQTAWQASPHLVGSVDDTVDTLDTHIDGDDYITISAVVPAGEELLIHTVSLWEGPAWVE
jgi:hypothetical protein